MAEQWGSISKAEGIMIEDAAGKIMSKQNNWNYSYENFNCL